MHEEPVGTWPYEVIAYGSLSAVFLIQLLGDSPLGGLIAFGCGVFVLNSKLRFGPIIYLIMLTITLVFQFGLQLESRGEYRPSFLEFNDVVMCAGVTAFVASNYRLQCIWYQHLSPDPRQCPKKVPIKRFRLRRRPESPKTECRSWQHISEAEVVWLILTLPIWVVLAQFLNHLIPRVQVKYLDPWLVRILTLVWALGLGTYVLRCILELWKYYWMNPTNARLFLQDTIWSETRREQREIQRWLAWKRMKG